MKMLNTFLQKVAEIDLEHLLLLQIDGFISSRFISMRFRGFSENAQKCYYTKPFCEVQKSSEIMEITKTLSLANGFHPFPENHFNGILGFLQNINFSNGKTMFHGKSQFHNFVKCSRP